MKFRESIQSLAADDAMVMLSREMWAMFGDDIVTGRVIAYLGLGEIHFKAVN